MLAWSAEEAGRIIETYKIFENKPPDMIMERQDSGPYQKVLIKLIENSCSSEASSGSARCEVTCPLKHMQDYYHVCKSPPLDPA